MGQHADIYKTNDWRRARCFVIQRSRGLCERCLAKGILKKGHEVHHKIWLNDENKKDWHIAYNPKNLEHLCTDCHNETHDRSTGLTQFLEPVPPGGSDFGPAREEPEQGDFFSAPGSHERGVNDG